MFTILTINLNKALLYHYNAITIIILSQLFREKCLVKVELFKIASQLPRFTLSIISVYITFNNTFIIYCMLYNRNIYIHENLILYYIWTDIIK